MKVILVGYEGSQKVVKASKFLADKYLGWDFDITYINYGGDVNKWASFLCGYFTALKDKYVIFALDDYLLSDFINIDTYNKALFQLGGDVVCVKLCHSTEQEHKEYPVTTQYCVWDREYLIELLSKVSQPWEFEIHGSKIFDKKVWLAPCLEYFTNSSISSRWEGVRLDGLKEEDKKYIIDNGLITE